MFYYTERAVKKKTMEGVGRPTFSRATQTLDLLSVRPISRCRRMGFRLFKALVWDLTWILHKPERNGRNDVFSRNESCL